MARSHVKPGKLPRSCTVDVGESVSGMVAVFTKKVTLTVSRICVAVAHDVATRSPPRLSVGALDADPCLKVTYYKSIASLLVLVAYPLISADVGSFDRTVPVGRTYTFSESFSVSAAAAVKNEYLTT